MRKIAIFTATFLCIAFANAQNTSEQCKLVLMKILGQYSHLSDNLQSGQVKSFTLSMLTESKKGKSQESKLEMMVGPNIQVAKSIEALSISDSTYTFTLIKPTKVLFKNKSLVGKVKDSSIAGISGKMLSNIAQFECKDILVAGVPYQKIICTPSEDLRKEAQIERLEYIVDAAHNIMVSSSIWYDVANPLKSTIAKYSMPVVVAKPAEYPEDVYQYFFKEKNTLKEKFKGYKFFDNTNKK